MTEAGFTRVSRTISLMLIVVFFCPFAYGKIIYVDDDGQADFDNIQAGIDTTDDGDTVLVAPGTYTGQGNRDINFRGKAITVRSTDPNDPAIIASTIIDCQGHGRGFIFESGEQAASILEGITIIHGKAESGGGILVSNSSPTISRCTIRSNSASPGTNGGRSVRSNSAGRDGDGGGIYIHGGQPIVSQCSIIENTGGRGGGFYIHESSPLISHCAIADNDAMGGGGLGIVGMGWPDEYTIRVENCRITGNSANSQAGGLYAILCTLHMSNCVISGNRLLYGGGGGGLSISGWAIAEIHQCTIVGNKVVQDPPGVNCVGGGLFLQMCDVKVANSIIRRNRATKGAQLAIHTWDGQQSPDEPPINDPTLVTLHHNDFNSEQDQEVYIYGEPNLLTLEMYSNLDVDPCFADAGFWDPNGTPDDPNDDFWVDGDYHLKSQAGRWDPNSGSWIVDDVTSPCIDAGDPNSPIGHEPFPNGGIINMGAYSGTQEASKSYILAKIIYVDDDAVGNNDGSSWQNAYTFLQDALTDAGDAEKPVEIHVAQGVYKPDQGRNHILGDRAVSFHLINGVSLIGGYAGTVVTDPNARNVELFETILSGDLNGDDIDVNDPCDLRNEPTRKENSERIIEGGWLSSTDVLDGFTICSAFGPFGSGMDIYQGNPTIVNCTFKGNTAYHDYGGGLLNSSGNPKLLNCMFTGNYAKMGGGMCSIRSSPTLTGCAFTGNYAQSGAGLCNMKDIPKGNSTRDSNSTLIDCTFIDNNARFRGGGIYNGGSDSHLSNCTFSSNSSLGSGAGMYNRGSNHVMTDCTFSRNTAFDGNGGGIWNDDVNELTLANCTFSNNSSKFYGGGIAGKTNKAMMINCLFVGNKVYGEPGKPYDIGRGGGLASYGDTILANCTFAGNWARNGRAIFNDSSLKLYNCVLWDGGNEIFDPIQDSMAFIAYSNIQNSREGTDNINEDPLFANPGYWTDADDPNIAAEPNDPNAVWIDGDYHLKSQAGRWDPVNQSWVQDDVTSLCIDAGDPNSPIGHEPFPNGGIINMGAYGGTEQASMSL